MAYKMKGSTLYGKGNQSPAKQLKPEYMRTPEEQEFYTTGDNSTKYKPVPMGTYRSPGAVSEYIGEDEEFDWDTNTDPKKKGDTISLSIPRSKKKTFDTDITDMVDSKTAKAMSKTKRQKREKGTKRNIPHARDSFNF